MESAEENALLLAGAAAAAAAATPNKAAFLQLTAVLTLPHRALTSPSHEIHPHVPVLALTPIPHITPTLTHFHTHTHTHTLRHFLSPSMNSSSLFQFNYLQ